MLSMRGSQKSQNAINDVSFEQDSIVEAIVGCFLILVQLYVYFNYTL